jgi:hypothetical protein
VDAVIKMNNGAKLEDFDVELPTIATTILTTAILDAGSEDSNEYSDIF